MRKERMESNREREEANISGKNKQTNNSIQNQQKRHSQRHRREVWSEQCHSRVPGDFDKGVLVESSRCQTAVV